MPMKEEEKKGGEGRLGPRLTCQRRKRRRREERAGIHLFIILHFIYCFLRYACYGKIKKKKKKNRKKIRFHKIKKN